MNKLSKEEITVELNKLDQWSYLDGHISKKFVFIDFVEAYSFISKVALISEQLQHHPDWSGVYNKVTIRLSTHDVDGVTMKDVEFAQKLESYIS